MSSRFRTKALSTAVLTRGLLFAAVTHQGACGGITRSPGESDVHDVPTDASGDIALGEDAARDAQEPSADAGLEHENPAPDSGIDTLAKTLEDYCRAAERACVTLLQFDKCLAHGKTLLSGICGAEYRDLLGCSASDAQVVCEPSGSPAAPTQVCGTDQYGSRFRACLLDAGMF